jgi:hypothetical protein
MIGKSISRKVAPKADRQSLSSCLLLKEALKRKTAEYRKKWRIMIMCIMTRQVSSIKYLKD